MYIFVHILRAKQESLNKHIYFNTLLVLSKFNKYVLLGLNNIMAEYLQIISKIYIFSKTSDFYLYILLIIFNLRQISLFNGHKNKVKKNVPMTPRLCPLC